MNSNDKLQINNDGPIQLALGKSRKEKLWQNREVKWSQFLERLGRTIRTRETVEEYVKLPKGEQDEIKDVGGFVGGELREGCRKSESVVSRSLITLDADFAPQKLWESLEEKLDYSFCIYSTHKHTPEKPRLRIVIPLSRAVGPEEYQAISRRVAADIGMEMFDETTHEPSRLMYWPSTSSDGEFIFNFKDARWLSPQEVLNKYVDWRDTASWPELPGSGAERKRHAIKLGNPREKKGMVGAFCRAYSVPEAIDKFLNTIYTSTGNEDRYTFAGGSTSGGLVIYEEGDFAYSHHGTDPAGGRLLNSFDLVRLHKFGSLDVKAEEGTPIAKLPSWNAMLEFCSKDEKVKISLGRERLGESGEEFSEEDKWLGLLDIDSKGKIKCTIDNIKLILYNDPKLKERLALNDFSHRMIIRQGIPWHRGIKEGGDIWQDSDDAGLRHYLEKNYYLVSKSKITDAMLILMSENKFHPIREYMESLSWDGVSRIESVFIDYLGAEDCPYTRTVTKKSLIAAVARVFEPGVKYDYTLVLVGKQGLGKSQLLRKLGQCWFSDSFTTIKGKEAFEQVQGVWLIEVGELAATRRAEAEYVKQFMSKQDDIFRIPYGKHPEIFPRQCVFFGTTNDYEFLKDKTGNRRYWPVDTGLRELEMDIVKNIKQSEIDQIWAEAYTLWKQGEKLYLDGEMEKEAKRRQDRFTEESTLKGMVEEYLEMPLPEKWDKMDIVDRRYYIHGGREKGEIKGSRQRTRVCAMEIWVELLEGEARDLTLGKAREINDVLRNIPGWETYKEFEGKLSFGKGYGNQRCFVRMGAKSEAS